MFFLDKYFLTFYEYFVDFAKFDRIGIV